LKTRHGPACLGELDRVSSWLSLPEWLSPLTTFGHLALSAAMVVILRLTWAVGRALVVWVQGRADVDRIKAAGEVLTELAKLQQDQADWLHVRLDRVRPPPPDELEPPAAS